MWLDPSTALLLLMVAALAAAWLAIRRDPDAFARGIARRPSWPEYESEYRKPSAGELREIEERLVPGAFRIGRRQSQVARQHHTRPRLLELDSIGRGVDSRFDPEDLVGS